MERQRFLKRGGVKNTINWKEKFLEVKNVEVKTDPKSLWEKFQPEAPKVKNG